MSINSVVLFLCCTIAVAHIQDITRRSVQQGSQESRNKIRYRFNNPIPISNANNFDNYSVNAVEDARLVHNFLPEDEYDVYSFTINDNNGIVNTMPWVKACKKYENRYLHVALLGKTTDPRFEDVSCDNKKDYNINWELPRGYGAILGINTPPPRGVLRPTVNITLPEGEFPDAYFIPYNSGELDPECKAFQQYQRNPSTGILGCAMPPERCPGSPFPFNQTSPFCPHYKVGNFCGPKPWRWINERGLRNGDYFFVVWEQNGNEVDYANFVGWNEQLRMGRLKTPYCKSFQLNNIPANCTCGTKSQLTLPSDCEALFPTSRLRSAIVYNLVVEGNTLHKKCDWVDNAPKYSKRSPSQKEIDDTL